MAELNINELHYGDNLRVLREKIPDEIADLIYLDPPFNSSRNFNLLFKQVHGDASPAQIMAFEDTWTWSPLLYEDFRLENKNAKLFPLIAALYDVLGPSEMMAYVLMMAPRLLELHKKLKPTGTLFLHCDPVASHYLKIILDVIFGPENFRNEVIWKRTTAHGDAKQGSKHFGRIHDTIFRYTKTDQAKWNQLFTEYEQSYVDTYYKYLDEEGERYWRDNLTAAKAGGDTKYGWRIKAEVGTTNWVADLDEEHMSPKDDYVYLEVFPPANRYWAYSRKKMLEMAAEGLIVYSSTGTPMFKRLLRNMKGRPVQDIWDDIRGLGGLGSNAKERRGYPTQKPLALLERIISASTDAEDVVLDPFCGCGTAIVAAERMDRKWIGIDITYLAISEVVYRLNSEKVEGKPLVFKQIGTPTDALGAAKLFEQTKPQNHKPFEQFCVSLVAGEYREKMGADRGIDGLIHLWDFQGKLNKIVIQVKGGNGLTLSSVRDFASVIKDNDAVMGLMISMKEPTSEMRLVSEQQGFADWPSQRKYPKLQIRTVKQLLESPREPFEIPDSGRIPKSQGVGKLQRGKQLGLEFAVEEGDEEEAE
ncbi:MAG TPA: site-specific DNA-methyltransferase [Fimbriimonadaceae bacterium]|jgi:DNA modification methylase